MMVGVPVLFMVWVGACWPFTWVMAVGVGVSWWRVFQYWVAVVPASSVVPGVLACVGWLVLVGVCGLVWFRMLTCLASFFLLVLSFVLSCCLVNNGSLVAWAGARVLWAGESVFVCFLWVIGLLFVCWSRVVCVWGYWLLSCL